MRDFFDNPGALDPFLEELLWQQKKQPKSSAVVRCAVFHGRKEIEAYSSMGGVIKRYSDTWTVTAPISQTIFAQFAMGDTLTRMKGEREVFTVQNVIKEDGEWIISVSGAQAIQVTI